MRMASNMYPVHTTEIPHAETCHKPNKNYINARGGGCFQSTVASQSWYDFVCVFRLWVAVLQIMGFMIFLSCVFSIVWTKGPRLL